METNIVTQQRKRRPQDWKEQVERENVQNGRTRREGKEKRITKESDEGYVYLFQFVFGKVMNILPL